MRIIKAWKIGQIGRNKIHNFKRKYSKGILIYAKYSRKIITNFTGNLKI